MIIYLVDKLLRTLVILVGIGFLFFVANWHFYLPPPCAPGGACTTSSPEIQAYWDSLAKPAFDWFSIPITMGLIVVLTESCAQLNARKGLYP